MYSTSGLENARRRMIYEHLLKRGIKDQRVLDAMERVPRERFVATSTPEEAYEDRALNIGCGQTISQPYIVARMTEALRLTGAEHVLEIGTGSGYQTAVLAELAHDVVSIERHADLAENAARVLESLGYDNVKIVIGDGAKGWPDEAPYDGILAAAAATQVPRALFDQLRDGGTLVIPIGDAEGQMLYAIRKIGDKAAHEPLTACRFVPFVGA